MQKGGAGFRGLASRLREQARDAVQVVAEGGYKLPTFDDMAKNDEYIHSPDFNVRGRTEAAQGFDSNSNSNKNENENNDNAETTATDDVASYYSHSTASSWSLLDRTVPGILDRNNNNSSNSNNNNNGNHHLPHKTSRSSSASLSTAASGASRRGPIDPGAGSPCHPPGLGADHCESESDESSEGLDGEDPVLAAMAASAGGKENPERQPARGHPSLERKSGAPASFVTVRGAGDPGPSHRFLDDVRLTDPLHKRGDESMEALLEGGLALASRETHNREPEAPREAGRCGGLFGGYFREAALGHLDRLKTGLGVTLPRRQGAPPAPPLARRERYSPKRGPGHERDTESGALEFETTTSEGMLGREDLETLRKLGAVSSAPALSFRGCCSNSSAVVLGAGFWHEHRHFAFVAFTLGLFVYVYFFSQRGFADGVA